MAYLTYEEYQEITDDTSLSETDFNKYLKKASAVLDWLTRRFYVMNDLESDHKIRREAFKDALAGQVQYFGDSGVMTASDMGEPDSFSIGGTSVSNGSDSSSDGTNNDLKNMVCPDIYIYLEGTGLLARGVE
ncbi:hypothetical protein RAZ63_001495 [Listeria monocytogenes]|uniref:hypothetical protein n=1 Tax=Listeria monocytogenes TaxID=1639 RepID=UPI0011EAEA95|nr:hypothetical protein [Listeria monocytogenes]EAV9834817.1 hypothetical protein [Listeria monocytogenes]ECQ6208421.1 hypothetical protein [Listeria monocytogenes]ECQ6576105.1 hypothetical protein [Listeria monocytogenes]EIZ6626567.1 hypothetical protein [Listeria monocytogenes]EKZ1038164.1 hypothetical protein [Listeria monocytogenes]